ncbi:TetR/AcrR family transcriptional regulator [Brevibacterium jeotgali]|uniref:Transcriptional regulator, TetR family n=1 Tax=Brevibacterium jeotgali TaxID=1262550 RepID=A0A2H1L820_9MICO|nr:TetR family transcriptional regulator [Brevibacterium jeotgali]TWC03367.1 TetR family transcriptional regulator [Brevibacterium jeotgali]SMY13029.1 transcriptional regulator, TetR family [Brevibacterium jeotgali]
MSRGLNRTRILEAATAHIDAHGPESLTMRGLGSQLGVEAMALYRHVPGKDHLLAAVVDRLVDDVLDDPRITAGSDSWEEYLHTVGTAMRDLEAAHPRTFSLVATRPPEVSWLRPPLRSIRWVEHFLSTLVAHGCSPRHAVRAYREFTSFLLGHLLLDAASREGETFPEEIAPADHPTVAELQDLLHADHAAREFDEGLDALIEHLRVAGA